MSKIKKIALILLGVLLALNIASTLMTDQMKTIRSEVSAFKADATKLLSNHGKDDLAQLKNELEELKQKNARLEQLVKSLIQNEQLRLKNETARISDQAQELNKLLEQ